MYLSGAGVGEIGIVDGDKIDESNLHRQIIHTAKNKDLNKSISAKNFINNFNPLVKINTYETHFNNKNCFEIAEKYDILVDCSDNPATRYLVNDVSVILKKPLISGSAVKWEGQLTIYGRDSVDENNYNKLPCYRCLFPIPSPVSSVCNCADAGVFGTVPGVIGTMQCNEIVKLILGEKERLLANRMLMYDAYEMSFKVFKLRSNQKDCKVCGENPTFNKDNLKDFDYDDFVNPKICRLPIRLELDEVNKIEWEEFMKLKNEEKEKEKDKENNYLCIDVRPKDQFDLINLKKKFDFINCPLAELKMNFEKYENEIFSLSSSNPNKERKIFVMCKGGNASTHATKFLIEKGYKNVYNINNGIIRYRKEIDNQIPIY
jgi:adenylyltransferase/sulfurtransferase